MNCYQVLKTIWVCITQNVIIKYEYLSHILSFRCTNGKGYSCMYIDKACVIIYIYLHARKGIIYSNNNFFDGVIQVRTPNHFPSDALHDEQITK